MRRQTAAILMSEAEAGAFPPHCVRTGLPPTRLRRKIVATSPDWTWLLLLWSIVLWAISLFATGRSVTVYLPVADEARGLWAVTGRIEGPWLWLSGVHPAFARELGRRYAHLPPDLQPA